MKNNVFALFVILLISAIFLGSINGGFLTKITGAVSHDTELPDHPCGTNHDEDCDPTLDNLDNCDIEGEDHVDDGECDYDHEVDGGTQDYCGDGTCTDTEKYANDPCPADCCGDRYCSPGEDQYCPGDCEDVGPDPVVGGYPPCDPGDIAVCHSDCSCRCEDPSYSGPNYAPDCPNRPEETPVEVTPVPDEYDVGITNVNAPYPDQQFLESVIFDFEITNWNAPTAANWDV